MKREHGTGSVTECKGRYKPFRARIRINGTMKHIGYFYTKFEAESALRRYLLNPIDPNITFAEVFDTVLEQKEKEIKSADAYRVLRIKFTPLFKVRFADIKTQHLQQLFDAIDSGRPTKQKMKVFLSLMYQYAMANDIVDKDYAQFVKLPTATKTEKEIFSTSEIQLLLNNRSDDVDTILLMIFTGMRLGEMFALTSDMIDWDSRLLVGFGNKTEEGRGRVVPMSPLVEDILHKRFDAGRNFKCDKSNYYNHHYKKALAELGISYKSPHSCRHTFATMLGESGASTLNIQKLLGHTDYSLTANVYSHPDVKSLRECVSVMTQSVKDVFDKNDR